MLSATLPSEVEMGGASGELSGPDLGQGVAIATVKEGEPLLGHAGGEAVVLVRQRGQLHAIGASCSHYGGPLAEGLVVDGQIRCPWHHACFDLATGAALAAPALSPIASYDTSEVDGLVKVGAKRPAATRLPVASGAPAAQPSPKSIVIVGAGAAGHACAERLRALGYAGQLTLVGADEAPPVDRPNLSKDYLAGNAPEEWIPLRPPEAYAEGRIELVTATPATGVDVATRQVTLADGRNLGYDRLLLATGADPVRLNVPGAEHTHVHTLRTLADSRAIIARAVTARHAVVVGASFIGLEAAAALRTRGLMVHVVAPDARPLERVLGAEVGDFVRALHEEKGVKFHLGDGVASIGEREVKLTSGRELLAELVVVGIGVRPSTALADQAKLHVDRGIVVDAELVTSAPDVLAAGDVARFPGARGEPSRIEHWVVAQRMGQTAAHNLLGAHHRFNSVPFFWSAHYDVTLAYVGHAAQWDRIDRHGSLDARDATVAYRLGGATLAVVTVGRDRVSLEAELAFERGDVAALADFGTTR
jgi:NADPH-dependent 2,4-dienoyl-CoA reductase/sulfur reductase-like enzyme/nitrite reductase/ring-hydroxylating ferredoxin subunit